MCEKKNNNHVPSALSTSQKRISESCGNDNTNCTQNKQCNKRNYTSKTLYKLWGLRETERFSFAGLLAVRQWSLWLKFKFQINGNYNISSTKINWINEIIFWLTIWITNDYRTLLRPIQPYGSSCLRSKHTNTQYCVNRTNYCWVPVAF